MISYWWRAYLRIEDLHLFITLYMSIHCAPRFDPTCHNNNVEDDSPPNWSPQSSKLRAPNNQQCHPSSMSLNCTKKIYLTFFSISKYIESILHVHARISMHKCHLSPCNFFFSYFNRLFHKLIFSYFTL